MEQTRTPASLVLLLALVVAWPGAATAQSVCTVTAQMFIVKSERAAEFSALADAESTRDEAIRCCVACIPPKGTRVVTLDSGLLRTTVRVIDTGQYYGCQGDIGNEFLDCDSAATTPRIPKRRDLADLLKSYASLTTEQRADLIAVLPGDILSGTAALNRVSKENAIVDRCGDVHLPDSSHWPNCTLLRLQAPADRPGASASDAAVVPIQLVAPGTIGAGELGHALLPDGTLTFDDCRIVHAEDWFGHLVVRCDLPSGFHLTHRVRSQEPIESYDVKARSSDISFVRSFIIDGKPLADPWTLPGTVVVSNETFTNASRLVDVAVTLPGLPPITIGKMEFIELKTVKDGQVTNLTRREQGVGTIAVHRLRAPAGAPRIAHVEWLEDWGGNGPVVSVGYMFVLLDTGAVIGEGSIDAFSGESINTKSAEHYTAALIGTTIHVVKYKRRWEGRSPTDEHPPLALALAEESFDISGAIDAAMSSIVSWLTTEARWFREHAETASTQKAACSAGIGQDCAKFSESLQQLVDRYKSVKDRAAQAKTGGLARLSPQDLQKVDQLLKAISDHVQESM